VLATISAGGRLGARSVLRFSLVRACLRVFWFWFPWRLRVLCVLFRCAVFSNSAGNDVLFPFSCFLTRPTSALYLPLFPLAPIVLFCLVCFVGFSFPERDGTVLRQDHFGYQCLWRSVASGGGEGKTDTKMRNKDGMNGMGDDGRMLARRILGVWVGSLGGTVTQHLISEHVASSGS